MYTLYTCTYIYKPSSLFMSNVRCSCSIRIMIDLKLLDHDSIREGAEPVGCAIAFNTCLEVSCLSSCALCVRARRVRVCVRML